MPAVDTESFHVTSGDGRVLEGIVGGPADGRLVIGHHGTPGSAAEIWPPHLEAARERGLRLAIYSRPGYAGSERDPDRTVASCTADTALVADALGAERFLTFGGSGGGAHALACAALLPQRVLAVAAIAGVAPADADGLDWLEGMGQENIDEFNAMNAGPKELEAFIDRWAGELRQITGERVRESLGELVSPPDAAVLTGEYAEFSAAGIRASLSTGIWGWFDDDLELTRDWGFDLASIGVPASVWQGRQDRFVPPAHGEWLAARVPGAKAYLLDDHGHLSLSLAHFGAILDELVAQSST